MQELNGSEIEEVSGGLMPEGSVGGATDLGAMYSKGSNAVRPALLFRQRAISRPRHLHRRGLFTSARNTPPRLPKAVK